MVNKKNNKNKTAQAKSKRWFAGASGWGVEVYAGSDSSSSLKGKRSVVPQPPATKFNSQSAAIGAGSVLHNTIYTHNICTPITQSTADNGRIGDFIRIKMVSCNIQLDPSTGTTPGNGGAIRLMLVASPVTSTAVGFSSGLGTTDLFYTAPGSQLIANPNPKLCKVLCDEIFFTVPPGITGAGLLYGNIHCKVDSIFEYKPSVQLGVATNLFLVMIPYGPNGTTGTTTIGKVDYEILVSYEDQ
jgi:hypothetical protein